MQGILKSIGSIFALGLFLIVFNTGGVAGCGTSGTSRAATDDGVTATSDDASAAYADAFSAALAASNTSQAGLTVDGSNKLAQAIDAIKNSIEVSSASSCSEGAVPSPTGDSATVQGSDIFSGGSGNCTVSWDEGSDTFDVLVDCADLSDGTETLDGKLGFFLTVVGSDLSLDVGSEELTYTFDGDTCSLIADLGIVVSVSDDGSATVTANGCLGLCGEFFSISGEEDLGSL